MQEQIAAELREKRESVVLLMVERIPSEQTADERRQFISGFVDLVIAAAEGNTSPRDEYLAVVIPGCKAAGLDFGYIVSAMVPVSMALAASVSTDSLGWCATFCMDYTQRLIATWQKS